MKIFGSTSKQMPVGPRLVDAQSRPAVVGTGSLAQNEQIKIDLAFRSGAMLVVAGWVTADFNPKLIADEQELNVREVRVDRPDVAAHLKQASGENLGFVLVTEHKGETDDIVLRGENTAGIDFQTQKIVFSEQSALNPSDHFALGSALGLLAGALKMHSHEWRALLTKSPIARGVCRNARGFLEGGAACEQNKEAVLVGWVVHTPGTVVWLEDQTGKTYSLEDAYRRFRQDVHDAVGNEFGHASRDAGFILRLQGVRAGSVIRLKTISENGVHILSETTFIPLPVDPVAAARWLFAVGTPVSELYQRVGLVDEPVIKSLIDYRQTIWDELPVTHRQLGESPADAKVSIIIPLYGRMDFVEHQLIEFARDPWLLENAEIIYIVDDSKLAEPFGTWAETLHRLYRVPFAWVWGSVNRGFSGANNLGAKYAHGDKFLFLNSDAFPQQAGWLPPLLDVLDKNPEIGAVGPRLLFADGSIQHAGMEFLRRDELGVWVNHHPRMGLDPSLDPHQTLTNVSGVTGACLAMRRADFDTVGGWDTGYLIGDFEDSDLCLKLRKQGLKIAYLPTVQLTHLERQSFKLLGQDEFRTKVVIFNAVRHQNRWRELIETSAAIA